MIYVDRSRIQAFLECPRMRFLRYHYPDEDGAPRGLERVEPSTPQLNGSFVHQAFELILTGMELDEAISVATGSYLLALPGDADEFHTSEQLCLLEGLVRAWAKVRLPLILAEYQVVSIEEELRWPIESQIIDMVRCDVVLRRKSDGLLFILEFKTTSIASEDWAIQWEHNSQVLLNTMAIQETFGEPVGGMLIEGIVKGKAEKEWRKTSPFLGRRIQQSTLCYLYQSEDGEVSPTYTYGWKKRPVWEVMSPKEWVAMWSVEELNKLFRPVPAIKPVPQELMSTRRQTIAQEKRIDGYVKKVIPLMEVEDLDECFPKNHSHCYRYWGYPCSYLDVCYDGGIGADPVGSGKYRWRRPHHEEGELVGGKV